MASVLRSIKQTPSKFFVGLTTSLVGFAITGEDTAAPTAAALTISSGVALGTMFVDMGKIVRVLSADGTGATYRKLKLASAVAAASADSDSNTIWIQQDRYDGSYELNNLTQFARL
jgi:acetylornithine/succinyldiaminopimelate/putrescine aminotransferase